MNTPLSLACSSRISHGLMFATFFTTTQSVLTFPETDKLKGSQILVTKSFVLSEAHKEKS